MIQCYITNRAQLGGGAGDATTALLANIERQIRAGVDWIQLREKDLGARELFALSRRAVELAAGTRTRIILNSRLDIALAAGAGGLHLPSGSAPPRIFRRLTPEGFLIGVSCHTLAELQAAEAEGADYALLGPLDAPRSKQLVGEALGLDRFSSLVREVRIPVLALGGITSNRVADCARAGAAGFAAISHFQQP